MQFKVTVRSQSGLMSALAILLLGATPLFGQATPTSREAAVASNPFSLAARASQVVPDLNLRNVPLSEALDRLFARGVPLIYSSDLVKNAGRVSCEKCADLEPKEILTRLLRGTGIGFRELPGGELVLSRNVARAAVVAIVRGRIVEATTGNGIERAVVSVVGTGRQVLTRADGRFDLADVPSGPQTIRVTRLGYTPANRSIVVPDAGDLELPAIALDRLAIELRPLEVTASTGSLVATERKKIGNSIVIIDSSEIRLSGARDLPEMLRARAPGVEASRTSGANGSGGAIQIRGVNSIFEDQTPLVYIDGVPVDAGASALNGRGLHSFSGPDKNVGNQLRIDELTLDEIDRIEIIKGPAATTMYGTQGSNGVIQIFTKRGTPGETRVTVRSEIGVAKLRAEDDFAVDLPYRDQFLSQFRSPRIQEHHVGLSGGSGDVSYNLGATHAKDDGYIPRNGETRSSLTTSFRAVATPKLSFQMSGSLVRRDFESAALYLGSNRTTVDQALETVSRTDTQVGRFYGALSVDYHPTSIWLNRLTVGVDDNDEVNERVGLLGTPALITRDRITREFRRTSGSFVSSLNYPQTGRFTSTFSVGGEAFHDVTDRLRLRGQGLPSFDVVDFDLATAILGGDQGIPTDLSSKVAQVGGFMQEQLGFNDRLFITVGLRADGNSAFGDDYGIQTYPKLGASYVINPASWWNAKVRTAWGKSGKAPPPFAKDLIFALTRPVTGSQLGQPIQTLFDLGNPDLRPELATEWEIGTENYFFDNRASLELNYFRNTTQDAHIRAPVPLSTGLLAGPLANIAELRSSGVEVGIRLSAFDTPSRGLDLGFTLTRLLDNGLITRLGNDPILTRFNQGFEAGTFEGLREGFSVRDLYFTEVFTDTLTPGYSGRAYTRIGSRVPVTFGGVNMNLRFGRASLYTIASYQTGGFGFDQTRFDTDRAIGYLGTSPNTGYALSGMPPWFKDRYIFRTDQFKIELLRLSYHIPSRFLAARDAEFWVEGNNLLAVDRYDRGDPEGVPVESSTVGYTGGRPILPPRAQMYKFGARLTF
jgi:TonB-dependent SusC/RagA subfamily outer membrane receptor